MRPRPISPMHARHHVASWLTLGCLVGVAACTGAISPGDEEDTGTNGTPGPQSGHSTTARPTGAPGSGPGAAPDPGVPSDPTTMSPTGIAPLPTSSSLQCKDPSTLGVTPLRRLTSEELKNTLTALLGTDVFAQLKTRFDTYPADDVRSDIVKDFDNHFTSSHASVMMEMSEIAAHAIVGNDATRKRFFGDCGAGATITDDCVRSFVKSFGTKVFRRPLTDADMKYFMDLYAASPDPVSGRELVIATMLQLPDFLYLMEVGTPGNETAKRFELTPYEVASRVSYLTTASMPDDELFAHAADGTLKTPTVLAAQVDRLLAKPDAKAHLKTFFTFWLDLQRVRGLPDSGAFLNGFSTSGLLTKMTDELNRVIEQVAFTDKGTYHDLMTTRRSFATEADKGGGLAKFYGQTAEMVDGKPVNLVDNHRPGVLLRGPLIASGTDQTHPVVRGKYVHQRILCREMPPPPQDALQKAATIPCDPKTMSTAQCFTEKTKAAGCNACHSQINPIGYALEQFDAIGRVRTIETMYDKGKAVAMLPLPTMIDVPGIDPNGPVTVNDAAGLVDAIASSDTGQACFARQAFRFINLRPEANSGEDDCLMGAALEAMQKGGGLVGAMRATILNQYTTFRRAQ